MLAGVTRGFRAGDGPHSAGGGRGAAGRRAGALRAGRGAVGDDRAAAGAGDDGHLPGGAALAGRAMRCRACWLSASCWPRAAASCTGAASTGTGRWPVWVTPQFSAGRAGRRGAAAVRRHHGLAEPARAWRRSALRAYAMPVSPVITATGAATLLLAPFGAFALNLAAITAAICMGREAHDDPARRYVAAGGGRRLLHRAGPGRRRGGRPARRLSARAGGGGGRAGAAGHDRRRAGSGAERRAPPRRRRADLSGHAVGREPGWASARPSGAWWPAARRSWCNTTAPALQLAESTP